MSNVLFIHSDTHNAEFMGNCGSITRTPNLDRLAATGARFDAAYCNSPLCVPSRCSMFTGRYCHEIGAWSNAFPWDGSTAPSWARELKEEGVNFTTIGKLHFKEGGEFEIAEEICPGHVRSLDPVGLFWNECPFQWEKMYLGNTWGATPTLDDAPPSAAMKRESEKTELAIDWLESRRPKNRPWALYVGYNAPHPKWTPRKSVYDHYIDRIGNLPVKYTQPVESLHPIDKLQAIHTCAYERDEETLNHVLACYHGAVEELDGEIGRVLETLEALGLDEDTLIIYSSDHGEMLRSHGKWGKLSLYEGAVRVPLILSGPGVKEALTIREPVSLLDVFPTLIDYFGGAPRLDRRGRSLLPLARSGLDPEREKFVMSEIHGNGWPCGGFTVRTERWKLMEYVGHRPALYDLVQDPDELHDLVLAKGDDEPQVAEAIRDLRAILHGICDPDEVGQRAKHDKDALRAKLDASGQLAEELARRGLEYRGGTLKNIWSQ